MIKISTSLRLAEHTIWQKYPANDASQSLSLGNGRISCFMFGGVNEDKVLFNESDFWNVNYNNDISNFQSQDDNLEDGTSRSSACPDVSKPFKKSDAVYYEKQSKALGCLLIRINHMSRISKYRRELRLDKAIHKVTYTTEGKNYSRESFVSRADQVFVMRISCDKPRSVSFEISLKSDFSDQIEFIGNKLCFIGSVPANEYSQSENKIINTDKKLCFISAVSVKTVGGTLIKKESSYKVVDSDEAIIYLSVRTQKLNNDQDIMNKSCEFYRLSLEDIYGVSHKPYFDVFNQSIIEHKKLYDFSKISFEDEKNGNLSIASRIEDYCNGQNNNSMYSLIYNVGKYSALTLTSHYNPMIIRQYDLQQDLSSFYSSVQELNDKCVSSLVSSGIFIAHSFCEKDKLKMKELLKKPVSPDQPYCLPYRLFMYSAVGDGEGALKIINELISPIKNVYKGGNSNDLQNVEAPPYHPFQTYGNYILCISIIQMLIQFDENNNPIFLPALPKQWSRGKVSNICIEGNKKISFSWADGKITESKIEQI